MIRISQRDFETLKGNKNFDGLHSHIMSISRNGKGDVVWSMGDHAMYIRDENLGIAFQNLLSEWVRNNNIEVVQVPNEPASDPEIDAVTNPDPSPVQPVKTAVKATVDVKQNLKDLKETESRYKYWVQTGLLNSVENGTLIDAWMSTHETSYTPAGLDRAIEACRPSLQWYTPPVVEYLPGGKEVRLPLGTRPSSKYSVRQLQDLDRREKEAASAERRKKNTELGKSLV